MAAFWSTEKNIFFSIWNVNVNLGYFYLFLLHLNYDMTVLLKTFGRGAYSMRSSVGVESE